MDNLNKGYCLAFRQLFSHATVTAGAYLLLQRGTWQQCILANVYAIPSPHQTNI